MPTTLGGKKIVTKASGHNALTPPATSMGPPPPPAGPAPIMVPYAALSSSGEYLHDCSKINSSPVACKGNQFSVEAPANVSTQATGSDVVSHKEVGKAKADEGDSRLHVDNDPVCTTGHRVIGNLMTGTESVGQVQGPWLEAVGTDAGGGDASGAGAGNAGTASDPDDALSLSDPVAVATGRVIDGEVDLALPGLLPLSFRRAYTTANAGHRSAMGRGGWSHSFDQWIAPRSEAPLTLELFGPDGRRIYFEPIAPQGTTLHRRERLRLSRPSKDTYTVYDLGDRLTRTFSPVVPGGRAVLRSIRDGSGAEIALAYEGDRLARIVDTAERELRLSYAGGRLVRVEVWAEGKLQTWIDYAYGLGGELASTTDALGHGERYEYDGRHRLVKKTLSNGVAFRYEYEGDRCVAVRGDGGLQPVELLFDDEARTTIATGNEEPRRYTWDDAGFVVREETLDGAYVNETEYDEDHLVVAARNAAGEEVRFERDELGNLTKAIDPAGNETAWEYEGELLVKRIDPGGLETLLSWDPRGKLESVRDPWGLLRTLVYDTMGRFVRQLENGRVVRELRYDHRHNVVAESNGRGAVTTYAYDALGRVIESRNAVGAWRRTTYDRMGRPVQIEREDGYVVRRTYDPRGLVTRQEDSEGRALELAYAGTGKLVKVKDPSGQIHRIEYDALERPRRVVNPRQETYEVAYDRAGRLLEEKTFDERRVRYGYSRANRVSRLDFSDGGFRTFSYDPLGYQVEDRTPDGVIRYQRDELGFVLSATLEERGGKVVVEIERDAFHRVVAERVDGRECRYTYDAAGRLASRTLPGGVVTGYTYDEDGLLSGVTHRDLALSMEHDALGRAARLRLPGGVEIAWAHDPEHHVTGEAVIGPDRSERVRRRRWYNRLDQPFASDDGRWGPTHWAHDVVGRLSGEQRGRSGETYEIDATGAVAAIRDADPAHAGAWVVHTGNVLIRAGGVELGYDARRRRVRRTETDDRGVTTSTRMIWDQRDRLREVALPGGERVRFTYDAFGRRVRKDVVPPPGPAPTEEDFAALVAGKPLPGPKVRTVHYVWDGDSLAMEIDSERGERTFATFPRTQVPLLHEEQGQVFVYVTDPAGAPRELVDARGEVAWAGRLTPWGRLVEEQHPSPSASPPAQRPLRPPFRLLGQIADEETGLSCTKFRYWDAGVARWLSPDPLGIWGGPDLFGYNGDPLTHADPLGLACYLVNNTVRDSFQDGKYTVRVLEHDEVMWRAGVAGTPKGQFYGVEEPTSVAQARADKAILPVWPGGGTSPIDTAHQVTISAGTRVYEGTVAPQTGTDGHVYPGGTGQTVVPYGSLGSVTPIGMKPLPPT